MIYKQMAHLVTVFWLWLSLLFICAEVEAEAGVQNVGSSGQVQMTVLGFSLVKILLLGDVGEVIFILIFTRITNIPRTGNIWEVV